MTIKPEDIPLAAIEAFHEAHPLACTEVYDWTDTMVERVKCGIAAAMNAMPGADTVQADALAWRTLMANAEKGAWTYRVGHVTLLDKSARFDPDMVCAYGQQNSVLSQHPIYRAAFQWVNTGDCPTLRDALVAMTKDPK